MQKNEQKQYYYQPCRKTDALLGTFVLFCAVFLTAGVVYLNVQESHYWTGISVNPRQTEDNPNPESTHGSVTRKSLPPEKGTTAVLRGKIVLSENSRFPYYLQTEDDRTPLDLKEGDRFVNREVRLKVEYTGEGWGFAIVSIEPEE